MTVQDLIKLAVALIDDSPKINDYYNSETYGKVTMVISELVSKGIGIKVKTYIASPGSPDYTPDDENYTPIALPNDLTAEEQIEYVDVPSKTETHDGSLYLLVPRLWTQDVSVLYKPRVTAFASKDEELPITDEAALNVAVYGLAEMLAVGNAEEWLDRYTAKYIQAKREWIGKDYSPSEVQDYYGW